MDPLTRRRWESFQERITAIDAAIDAIHALPILPCEGSTAAIAWLWEMKFSTFKSMNRLQEET